MSDAIPCFSQDIWFEILKNLPVKILGKCRCVCKSWHSLIISPSFMATHLKHYTQNDANSLILYQRSFRPSETEKTQWCLLFRDLFQLQQGNCLHNSFSPLVIPQHGSSHIYFVGTVNGLLCLSDSSYLSLKDRILIWNPLVQKSIILPKSIFKGDNSVVGFGYDFPKNDHRVVKISYIDTSTPLAEVYSVQERAWRIICAKYLVDNGISSVSPSHCFYQGVIHWLTREAGINSSLGNWLLLFDVTEETFAKMELPQEIVEIGTGHFGIFEYQGKLSVSHCNPTYWFDNSPAHCRIWVRRDYNVESSWFKILCVTMLPGFLHVGPVEYLGENEQLIGFAESVSGEMVSYDPKTKQITELGLRVNECSKFSAYSESLALLDFNINNRDLTDDQNKLVE